MRAVSACALIGVAAAAWGCPKPIAMHIEVQPAVPAMVRVSLAEGKEPAVPAECQAPCSVAIPPNTKQALNIRAAGYYPASMVVSYDQVMLSQGSTGGDGVRLVIPLQQRLAPPATR